MANLFLSRLVGAAACALVLVATGCSRDGKRNAHVKQADQFFAAGEYDKAEIEYKNALQAGGLNAHVTARLGDIYYDQGRVKLAAGFLKAAVELDPNNLGAQLKFGYVRLGAGQVKEAQAAANLILERKPDHPEAPFLLAEAVAEPADLTKAREKLQSLRAPLPDSAPVLGALAFLDLREQKIASAITNAERAVQADPKNATARAILARAQWAQKDLVGAEKSFAAAAEIAPRRSSIHILRLQFLLQTGRNDDAKKQLAALIERTPDFLPPYIITASLLTNEKKYDASLELLNKVLAREADHPEALLLSAQNRTAKGEYDKALIILERATQLFAAVPQVHIQLAETYFAKGDVANAVTSYTQAIKLAPGLPAPSMALAQIQVRQRKFTEAIVTLKALLQNNPRAVDAQYLLADVYQRQDKLDEALSIYQQFVKAAPNNPQFHFLVGGVLQRQTNLGDARAAFDRALSLAPDQLAVVEQLVNVDIAEKKFLPAKTRVEAFIAKHPADGAAHLLLAKVYFAQDDARSAEAELKKAIDLQPDSPDAYVLLAQYYIATKQSRSAMESLQSAVAKSPRNPGPPLLLAILQEQEKNYEGARENYEKVLGLNPKEGVALNNLATLYSERLNNLPKALELAERAREAMGLSPEVGDTLGWVLYKMRQYVRAEAILAESAQRLGTNPEVLFHFGMVSYMMGNEDAARNSLEEAVKLSQAFAGIEEARQALAILALNPANPDKASRGALIQAVESRKDDPVALLRLAALDQNEGNLDAASTVYEKLIKANPTNVQASYGLIRVHQARNQASKALELGRALRKAVPNDPKVAAAVGRLAFESGDYSSAVGLLQDAGRRLNDDPEVLFDLGAASYSTGLVGNAETAFKSALESNPTFPRATKAREYLDMIAAAQNTPSDAVVRRIDALLKADANFVPALVASASVHEKKGDLKAAKVAFEKVLSRYPEFTPAKRQLAIYYSKITEDLPRGMELATKAREAFPNDPEVAKALGILAGRQGNQSRAISLLQESARSLTRDGEVMFYLGMAQKQAKQADQARKSLQRAIELGAPDSLIAEARRTLDSVK